MPNARKATERTAAQADVLTSLPAAMTGRASPVKMSPATDGKVAFER